MKILFWIAASGLELLWLWAPLTAAAGVVLWLRAGAGGKRRPYALLLTLLLPWAASALWTAVFANQAPGQPMAFPPIVAAEPTLGLAVELILALVLAFRLKGVRLAAVILGLMNLYVAFAVWFWGAMAISGDWI